MNTNKPNIYGYTTLMAADKMKLPFLETIYSWSRLCDKIFVCLSEFPKLDIDIPEGAVCPWDNDDNTEELLKRFDKDVLGGTDEDPRIIIIKHQWDPNNPGEDGATKQIARSAAQDALGDNAEDWLAQFDADEILREEDAPKLLEAVIEDNAVEQQHQRHPFITTGILELFGGENQVRFKFGNWIKIRLTRNLRELQHGMPLRIGNMAVRGRHSETGKIISIDNRDDGAGFISSLSLSRPEYTRGAFVNDPNVLNKIFEINQLPDDSPGWMQAALHLQSDLDSGVWIYHTGWVDIKRKWSMGWFFDNFWSVLSGKQKTFTEKAKAVGKFTRTNSHNSDEDLQKELQRQTIKTIPGLEKPECFDFVESWRVSIETM